MTYKEWLFQIYEDNNFTLLKRILKGTTFWYREEFWFTLLS